MTISAKVICDSINIYGNRLITFQLRYPRFIHAEFMTHRVFSRNASSSRAIPVQRLISDIINDPVYPSYWGANKPGMQAGDECSNLLTLYESVPNIGYYSSDNPYIHMEDETGITREQAWGIARTHAIKIATAFNEAGYHKQIVNRILEPFSHINVVCTATEYMNFFSLRRHPDAQPEIHILADAMWNAKEDSQPKILKHGEWHLPYLYQNEIDLSNEQKIAISVARCARVSYLTHDGRVSSVEEDLKLYERLMGQTPLHASPAEHQAYADRIICRNPLTWKEKQYHGNFNGFCQYRKTLEKEFIPG